jgi:hypothetical protein
VQQVQRAPWTDFPDVILHTNATKLKAHPSYRAAKAGDPASAIEVADGIIRPEKIDVDFDVVVPVMQMDTGKHNAIPEAAAFILAIKLNRKALLRPFSARLSASRP